MKNRILYYPSINIKDGIWLRNAVLYWEEVSSIMPYQNDDYDTSPEVKYLMETGHFIPSRPDDIMFSNMYEDFISEVKIRFDEYRPPKIKIGDREQIHMSKVIPDHHKLHQSKLSSHVIEMMEEKSEAIRSENNQWMSVDTHLSDIYMSVLAKYLAAISNADTSIGTDKKYMQNKIFRPKRILKGNNRQPFLDYQFNILPVPSMDVSIEDILLFKERRFDELRKLRIEINELESKLQHIEDIVELKSILAEFENRLQSNVSDLNRVMKEQNWMIKPTVMKGLISMSAPGIINTLETFGETFSPIQKGVAIASVTALNVGLTIKEIGNIKRGTLEKNPFAYVYHGKSGGFF